jgi:hypothetical protein
VIESCTESFRAGLRRSYLSRRPVSGQPLSFLESLRLNENPFTFQCGKQAAHRRFGAATTTAELEIVSRTGGSQRQCFAVCNPEFRQASNRLHLFGRIVKKLTKPQGSNRPESRVPKSDEPSFIRDVAKERTVFFPFALRPRITGM